MKPPDEVNLNRLGMGRGALLGGSCPRGRAGIRGRGSRGRVKVSGGLRTDQSCQRNPQVDLTCIINENDTEDLLMEREFPCDNEPEDVLAFPGCEVENY